MSEEQLMQRYEAARRAGGKGAGAAVGGSSDPEVAAMREELTRKRAGKGGRGDSYAF